MLQITIPYEKREPYLAVGRLQCGFHFPETKSTKKPIVTRKVSPTMIHRHSPPSCAQGWINYQFSEPVEQRCGASNLTSDIPLKLYLP